MDEKVESSKKQEENNLIKQILKTLEEAHLSPAEIL